MDVRDHKGVVPTPQYVDDLMDDPFFPQKKYGKVERFHSQLLNPNGLTWFNQQNQSLSKREMTI